MHDIKPLPDRDPARATLAAAIALEAGAVRDWRMAEQEAELAASDGIGRRNRSSRSCARWSPLRVVPLRPTSSRR